MSNLLHSLASHILLSTFFFWFKEGRSRRTIKRVNLGLIYETLHQPKLGRHGHHKGRASPREEEV